MLSDEDKARINQVLVDELGVDESEITPEANLVNDLGADSLDFIEIGLSLEEVFDLDKEMDPDQIPTVKHIYDLIEKR